MPRSIATDAPAIRIRRARDGDLAALIELENSAFTSDRLSARQLRHHLRNRQAELLVAVRGEALLGAAVVFFHAGHRSARLYSIAVAAHARGSGIGAMLLTAAERAAQSRDSATLRLEVRTDNAAARQLYERRGYRRIATKVRFYEDGRDAFRYEKTLTRHAPPRR